MDRENLNTINKPGLGPKPKIAIAVVAFLTVAGLITFGLYLAGAFPKKIDNDPSGALSNDPNKLDQLPKTEGDLNQTELEDFKSTYENLTPEAQLDGLVNNKKLIRVVLANNMPVHVTQMDANRREEVKKELMNIESDSRESEQVKTAAKELMKEIEANPPIKDSTNEKKAHQPIKDLNNEKSDDEKKGNKKEAGPSDQTHDDVNTEEKITKKSAGKIKKQDEGDVNETSEPEEHQQVQDKQVTDLLAKDFLNPEQASRLFKILNSGKLTNPDGSKTKPEDIKAKCTIKQLIKGLLDAEDPALLPFTHEQTSAIANVQKMLKDDNVDKYVKEYFSGFDGADPKIILINHLKGDFDQLKSNPKKARARFRMIKKIALDTMTSAFKELDFDMFKRFFDELIVIRHTLFTGIDSTLEAIEYDSSEAIVEYIIRNVVNQRLNMPSTLDAQIAAIAEASDMNLSAKVNKLNVLLKFLDALNVRGESTFRKKKELMLSVVESHMGKPDFADHIKSDFDSLSPDELEVPYCTTLTSKDDIIKFQKAEKLLLLKMDATVVDKHTAANAVLGKPQFSNDNEINDYVEQIYDEEYKRLTDEMYNIITASPIVEASFMKCARLIVLLRRSLSLPYFQKAQIASLYLGPNRDNIGKIINTRVAKIISDIEHDNSAEYELLARLSKEIEFTPKIPGLYYNEYVEIKSRDDFNNSKTIKVVKGHFKTEGAFASKLAAINTALKSIGISTPIDEAKARRILVTELMYREFVKSDDDPKHSQYFAIKKEIADEIKKVIETLDGDCDEFKKMEGNVTMLIGAFRAAYSENDAVEPKSNIGGSIPEDITTYFEPLLKASVTDLKTRIKTSDVPELQAKVKLANCMSESLYGSKALPDLAAFEKELFDEAIAGIFDSGNPAAYDRTTDLLTEPHFNYFKRIYMAFKRPQNELEVVLKLTEPHLNDATNAKAHNLYVYHYLAPQLNDRDAKAIVTGFDEEGIPHKAWIFKEFRKIHSLPVPTRSAAYKMLETQRIAGKSGNGLILCWNSRIVVSDASHSLNYEYLKTDNRKEVDPMIEKAIENVKGMYNYNEKSDKDASLKDAYLGNYNVLKSLHSNPESFGALNL